MTASVSGGGWSTWTACRMTWSKVSRPGTGKRSGSTWLVRVAIPALTFGRAFRISIAASRARSRRVSAPGERAASIDREMSITKYACASVRTLIELVERRTGWLAAIPSRAATAAIATARTRYPSCPGGRRPSAVRVRRSRLAASTSAASGTRPTSAIRAHHGVRNVSERAINSPSPGFRRRRRASRSPVRRRRSKGRAARLSRPEAEGAARGCIWRRRCSARP